ncbi:c-type cytochrome [Bosea sp. LjRoot9]|uniref:c-type cytochrome n=1 Tax=Bosea sp. LjRoot9 TaxID=3342341 RepID=UPI003ECDF80B
MRRVFLGSLALGLMACAAQSAQAQTSQPPAGQRLFQQRCGACHQIDTARNGVGPHLQGIIWRQAGSVQGSNVSTGLKESGITWTTENLDAFLANPASLVRGTRMIQRFGNAEERRAIIEFLGSR